MGKKYICEVKRDFSNNQLQLVNHKNYNTVPCSQGEDGAINFTDGDEMRRYFDNNCIAEDSLRRGNGIFVFLFYLLLFILLMMLTFQLVKSSAKPTSVANSAFGRFSF